jgi:hypothetical protein
MFGGEPQEKSELPCAPTRRESCWSWKTTLFCASTPSWPLNFSAGKREGRSVDVLFTDIQLGAGLSGWDLAATLRDKLPDIVVLFASGDASDRSSRVRGSTFFRKPYDLTDVADTCQSMLASPDDKH